jgi:hypothetical protein
MHIQRSMESGYSADTSKISGGANDSASTKTYNLNKIIAELGMDDDDLNSPEGVEKVKRAIEIKRYQSLLTDERERRQYYQNLPWLKTDTEQLEFLKQNGYYARQAWLRKNSIGKRAVEVDQVSEDLIAAKDISIGMPGDFVRRSWGAPDSVDIAGNPIYGNERWRYKRYSSSPEGYQLQTRIVYFEAGKVVGWEQVNH